MVGNFTNEWEEKFIFVMFRREISESWVADAVMAANLLNQTTLQLF